MTRNDYELLADYLLIAKPTDDNVPLQMATEAKRHIYQQGRLNAWNNTVRTVATGLSVTNKRFSFEKFYIACGLQVDGTNVL